MLRNKGVKFFLITMLVTFSVGIVVGSVYAAGIEQETAEEIHKYLSVFFEKGMGEKTEVMISSLYNNLKIFLIIFLAGFFKLAIPVTLGICCMEGFTSGFTAAALVKLMGWNGFLLSMSSVLSAVIFVTDLICFGAISMSHAVLNDKNDPTLKKNYIIAAFFSVTIFCVAAFFDGYITTTFMDMIVNKM